MLTLQLYGWVFQNEAVCMKDKKQNRTFLNKNQKNTGVSKSVRTNHHSKTSHWRVKAHMRVESMVPRETMKIQMITKVTTLCRNNSYSTCTCQLNT